MKRASEFKGVFIHKDPVDMRKGINGLCEVIAQVQMGEITGSYLFVFSGRRRDIVKVLYFDRSGFALWMKRLERDKFPWPKKRSEGVIRLTGEQFEWLLDGYDVWKIKPFETLSFERVI